MRFRFAPTFLALVLALAAGLALAGDSFPGFLPFSRGGAGGGGGGGLTPGAADAAYLRLDATNDPVTGDVYFGSPAGNSIALDGPNAFLWAQVLDSDASGNFAVVGTSAWDGALWDASTAAASYGESYPGNGYCTSIAQAPGSSEIWINGDPASESRLCAPVGTGLEMGVSTGDGATFENVLALTGTGAVVNDDGASDLDFRVEGDTVANLLVVDASADRVGIGTATPSTRLEVNGQAAAAVGSASAPSWSFVGDLNTGMYRSGADRIGFSTGGTDRAEITVSNLFSYVPIGVEAGTAGAPTLTFTNDQNTGFYSPAADTCSLATGGVERFTVSTTAATSTLPIRAPSGTAAAVGVGHSTMVDSGLAWDTGIDAMYLLNNTGSIAIDANGGGALSLDADATSYITIGGVGQDLIIDPSGDVEIAANLYPQASMIGTATTGTGPGGVGLWRHPRIVNNAPSKPTCDATWEGSTLYVDDSNDALAGMLCYCSADSGRATWGWLTTVGTTCP